MMMMMNRRITPVGPVIAMAYTHKLISEDKFSEVNKVTGEAFEKNVEERNSVHKSLTMNYQLFPADTNGKQIEQNRISPIIQADYPLKISSPCVKMTDIWPTHAAPQPFNDDIQFQSHSPQSLVSKDTRGSVTNEYKKNNSCESSQTELLNDEANLADSFPKTAAQVETKSKSWVELFKPKHEVLDNDSKQVLHKSDSVHAVHNDGFKAVSKISLTEERKKTVEETMTSQIMSDGWSEVKLKKNKCRKSTLASSKVNG